VATIKPTPRMDMAKVATALQTGGKMSIRTRVEFLRAAPRSEVTHELRLRREAQPVKAP
jgi:hypothetical protein